MVDFLKIVKQKTVFNEIIYYSLNLGLVILLFTLSQTIHSPVVAIVLVLLSKWRVFAVRPRYWWTNIQASAVDTIVGLGVVVLMYLPGVALITQISVAIAYALWLVVLKPQTKPWQMALQSFAAIFIGVTALYSISYSWPVSLVVGVMFVIGYSAARHILYAHEEEQITLISMIWGLFFAEIGWLAYYWSFGYGLPGATSVKLPQVTIITILMSFLAERIYYSWVRNKKVIVGDVLVPTIFTVLLIGVMLIFFNSNTSI